MVIKKSSTGNLIKERIIQKASTEFSIRPPFPKIMNVELSNVCNHSCNFCAYPLMDRQHGGIEKEKLEGWLKEAYELGARELGLHSGSEPFASLMLEYFIKYAKDVGYEYVYISTNGSLASKKRIKAAIDAGLDSIKFSINAGDRESYKKIHGKDHFDQVIENLRYAAEYRGDKKKPYLSLSFVITEENESSLDKLKNLTSDLVDEFISFQAANQSGQLAGSGERAKAKENICPAPFNKLHISREGFLRGCCNDYENLLALEDLNKKSLREAYYGPRYQEWRQTHMEDKLDNTLCYNCKYDLQTPVQPLNTELYFKTHDTDKGPHVSFTDLIVKTK